MHVCNFAHFQHLNALTSGTFDVREANESVINGQVCLDIKYVEGHEPNPKSSVAFRCTMTGSYMHNATIDGRSDCITVDPHPAYDVLITDEDAEEEIDTTAAVTIPGVFVPNITTTTTLSVTSTGLLALHHFYHNLMFTFIISKLHSNCSITHSNNNLSHTFQ